MTLQITYMRVKKLVCWSAVTLNLNYSAGPDYFFTEKIYSWISPAKLAS